MLSNFPPRIIRASAGSGKTFQLSTRILQLLAAGESIDHILASTFTRKAAGEICQRVFQRLALAAQSESEARKLATQLGIPLAKGRAGELLCKMVSLQHRILMCTLDSFCVQLARLFEVEAGLLHGWKLQDPGEWEEILEIGVETLLDVGDFQELLALVRDSSEGRLEVSVLDGLSRRIQQIYESLRRVPESAWQLPQVGRSYPREVLCADLTRLQVPLTGKKTPHATWSKAKDAVLAAVSAQDWDALLENTLLQRVVQNAKDFSRVEISQEQRDCFGKTIETLRAVFVERLGARATSLRNLVRRFEQILEQQGSRTSLSFTELKELLLRASVLGQLEPVYYRLDTRLHHLLLDEFQDTSLLEWQLIQPLVSEVLSRDSENSSFFCVGDVKQAIYGWRGGSAEIFTSLEHEYPQLSGHISRLNSSYRSSPVVIDAVNQICAGLAQLPVLQPYSRLCATWRELFQPHTAEKSELPGCVELRVWSADGGSAADAGGNHCKELVYLLRQRGPGSCALLFRDNSSLQQFLLGLRGEAPELRFSAEGGILLGELPATAAVIALLRWLDHPSNTDALYHVAHSPLGALLHLPTLLHGPERTRAWQSLQRELQDSGVGSLLSRCIAGIENLVDHREREGLYRLLQAAGHPSVSGLRLRKLAERLAAISIEESDPLAIRLMTIHRAKGLEFDTVILPELSKNLLEGMRFDVLLGKRESPLAPYTQVVLRPSEVVRNLLPEFSNWNQQRSEELLREEINLLYVALTRARQRLFFFVEAQEPEKRRLDWAELICSTLAPGLERIPGALLSQRGDLSLTTPVPGLVRPSEPQQTKKLRLLLPRVRSRALRPISPSDLLPIPVESPLQAPSQSSLRRGIALHALLSQVHSLPQVVDASAVLLPLGMSQEEILRFEQEFLNLMSKPGLSSLLRSPGEGDTVWRERRFAVRHQDTILSGVFDRVEFSRANGRVQSARVIDFKTDWIASEQELVQKNIHYTPQLEAYRLALSKMLAVEPELVETGLFYLHRDAYYRI